MSSGSPVVPALFRLFREVSRLNRARIWCRLGVIHETSRPPVSSAANSTSFSGGDENEVAACPRGPGGPCGPAEFGHYPWEDFQRELIASIGSWQDAPDDARVARSTTSTGSPHSPSSSPTRAAR